MTVVGGSGITVVGGCGVGVGVGVWIGVGVGVGVEIVGLGGLTIATPAFLTRKTSPDVSLETYKL